MKLLLIFITGVFPLIVKEIHVKEGDMVALNCGAFKHNDSVTLWEQETKKKTSLSSNMSEAEQRQLGVVVYANCLVILSASSNYQGNYSCYNPRITSSRLSFKLTVYTTQSKEYEESQYTDTCYTQQSCTLNCPQVNIPAIKIPSIPYVGITWRKKSGEPSGNHFPSVEASDGGVYCCTHSFLYSGQIYNTSSTVVLDVQTVKPVTTLGISSPHDGQVFHVQLGSTVVITCIAITDSCSESELFWLNGKVFVENDSNFTVFNNYTCDEATGQRRTSLVFKEVLEEHLSKNFTCKLQSDELQDLATITLTKIAGPSYVTVIVCTVVIVAVMAVVVVVYVKFKVDVTLFLRDSLGCQSSTSDGKIYDAFLMCYNSDTDEGLNEDDRRWLENTLEEQFGYTLCLYDRDVLPGQAVAEAVLDSVEQSRAVLLVPCCPDPGPGTGLLSAIHAALVERKTRLIFIKAKQTDCSESDSLLPEAVQLLSEAGDCITWKGRSPSTSPFWKQLRYHLPAPRRARKSTHQILPQMCYDTPLP